MARIKKIDRKSERNREVETRKSKYIVSKRRRNRYNKSDVASYAKPDMHQGAAKAARIAQKVGSESLKLSRTVSKSSERQGDQESAEQYESFVVNRVESACAGTAQKSVNLIRKKTRDIKNTRDVKSNVSYIRKADNSARRAEKVTRQAVKSATEAGREAYIISEKILRTKKAEVAARKSVEWVKKIVKGIIEGIKAFVTAVCAASVPLVLVLVIAGVIAAVMASAFGIFFVGSAVSGGNSESTPSLQDVVVSINQEYNNELDSIINSNPHDQLVLVGSRTSWADVLSVYAVSVTTDPDNPMDVVTMTDDRIEIIRELFWTMNTITYTTEEVTEATTVQVVDEEGNPETDDEGNPVMEEQESVTTILHIEVSHLTAQEEATEMGFTDEQTAELAELLDVRYESLWASVLGGVIDYSDISIDPSDNCQVIYTYLTTNMGLSHASACGIIANIQVESGFNPHALGDNGTSYGICQWHAGRWDNMKVWCTSNGYDWTTLDGQLHYLEHDLRDLHPSIYNFISTVEESSQGAYDAAYYWCVYFEIPADRYNKAITRGEIAQMYYFSI